MEFNELDHLPREFFNLHPTELIKIFSGPTLINLDHGKNETVLVSVMLHGNEHSGFYALKEFLIRYNDRFDQLTRNLCILIGNVEAAVENCRYLDSQKDFNRIWSNGSSEEEIWAQKVYDQLRQKNLFAALDLHNNTGKNPHYCAVTNLRENTLKLASLFEGDILYFTDPKEVFSNYVSTLCPSLTVEAGLSGDKEGIKKCVDLIEKVFLLDSYKNMSKYQEAITKKSIFESFGKIKIDTSSSISFDQTKADFNFDKEIENLNFSKISPGHIFGRANSIDKFLRVYDSNNVLIGNSFFKYVGDKIISIEEFYPAMITTNRKIIEQDCLCYILRPIDRLPLEMP